MLRTLSCSTLIVAALAGCGGGAGHQPPSVPPPVEAAQADALQAPSAPEPAPAKSLVATTQIVPGAGEGFETADEYTRQFYAGELDRLFQKFSSEMRTVMTLEQLRQNRARFTEQFGPEVAVVHRESQADGEHRAFMRWARFEKREEVIGVEWILRGDGEIAGFFVRIATPPERSTASPPAGPAGS